MRFRFFLLLILAGIAVYAVLWWRLAGNAEEAARVALGGLAAKGVDAEIGDLGVGGFPYRIALSLSDLALRAPAATPPLSLSASQVAVFTHPWTPDHYVAGMTALSGAFGSWVYRMPEARASWMRTREGRQIDIDIPDFALGTSDRDDTPIVVERAQVHIRFPVAVVDESTGLLLPERADLAVKLAGVALDELAVGAPAARIAAAELRAEVHGTLAFPLTRAGLAAWRDDGGTLEITLGRIAWGPARIDGSGSLTLDDEFRPLGALSLQVIRPDALMAYFAGRGVIDPGAAAAAERLVRALAAKAGDKGVDLPLSLQDGQLFLGGLAIARLGPVVAEPAVRRSDPERRRGR